jgi:predicted nucleotidyltransferase
MVAVEENISNKIKEVVKSFFPEAKVLLFGSRARGDFNNDSDYDLLIIVKDEIPDREKITLGGRINEKLVKTLHAPFDVLLNSEKEVDIYKDLQGNIIRWALREGIIL